MQLVAIFTMYVKIKLLQDFACAIPGFRSFNANKSSPGYFLR